MKGDHLWRVLVARGYFADKDEAVRWVLAGKVYVDNERMVNTGTRTPIDASIRIKGLDRKYVGKGGYKLEGALRDFALDIEGVVALDAGASTGGFTDCLLKHGASRVYAIDTGYGQLAGSLRADSRVVNMEKTNIGAVAPADLVPPPSLAAADLSYLSLRKAIPIITTLVLPESSLLCLVKPLFEIADSVARRTGAISDEKAYIDVLKDLSDFVLDMGLDLRGVTNSAITGGGGTIEFFLHIVNNPPEMKRGDLHLEDAVTRGLALT